MSNPLDAFFSGGGKSLSWGKVGSQEEVFWLGKPRGGLVISIGEPTQQTSMDTGLPLFWDAPQNTRPKLQIPITVDTNQGPTPERDPQDPSDTGHRVIWAKGGIQIAINEALRKAGNVPGSRMVGGMLLLAMTGTKPGDKGKNGMRVYAGQFTPGVAQSQATDAMFAGDPSQQQGGAPQYGQQAPAAQSQQPSPFGQQPPPPQQPSPFGQQAPAGQPQQWQQPQAPAAQQWQQPPVQDAVPPGYQQQGGAPQYGQQQPQAPAAQQWQQPAAQQAPATVGPNQWQQFDQPQAPTQQQVWQPQQVAQQGSPFGQQAPAAPPQQSPVQQGPVNPFG